MDYPNTGRRYEIRLNPGMTAAQRTAAYQGARKVHKSTNSITHGIENVCVVGTDDRAAALASLDAIEQKGCLVSGGQEISVDTEAKRAFFLANGRSA